MLKTLNLIAAIALFGAGSAHTQPVHLPPPERPNLKVGQSLITITPAPTGSVNDILRVGSHVIIEDGAMTIDPPAPNSKPKTILFGNRNIEDLKGLLKAESTILTDIGGARNRVHTRFLQDIDTFLGDTTIKLVAEPTRPGVIASLGAIYVHDPVSIPGESGVFSRGGFQIDLVGISPTWFQGKRLTDGVVLRVRLGIYSTEALSIETKTSPGPDVTTTDPVTNALQTAEQVALSGELNYILPLKRNSWSVSVEGGGSFAQLETFDFPKVMIDGQTRTVYDLFAEDDIEEIKSKLSSATTVNYGFLNATYRTPAKGSYLWYGGFGIGAKEVTIREISFKTVKDTLNVVSVVPNSLSGDLGSDWKVAGRVIAGFNLGEVEIHVDIISPVKKGEFETIWRVSATKPFRIQKSTKK